MLKHDEEKYKTMEPVLQRQHAAPRCRRAKGRGDQKSPSGHHAKCYTKEQAPLNSRWKAPTEDAMLGWGEGKQ